MAEKKIKIDCKGSNLISLNKLQNFQGNLKELSTVNYNKLRLSIEKYGFKFPIFVWKNNILDGHQRVFVLKKMVEEGWLIDKIPVIEIKAETEQEAKKLLLLINSRYGQMITDGLYEFLETNKIDLDFLKTELDFSGKGIDFDRFENEFYLEPNEKDDEVPEIKKTDIKLGDIFQLGEHRLLAGDTTKREDVERLMQGEKADMVFIDPPYSVNYGNDQDVLKKKSSGKFRTTIRPIIGDNLTTEECAKQLWGPAFKNLYELSQDDCSFYMTMCQGGDQMMMMMMMKENWQIKHELIWVKNSRVFSMGRLDYEYRHEPILFGWKKKHNWYGKGSFLNSVWEIPKPLKSDLHPTMKPIELIINALQNSSKKNDVVLDTFGGSGSTLIACEKIKRKCRMMEISPEYCEVIATRYEKFTGDKRVKL